MGGYEIVSNPAVMILVILPAIDDIDKIPLPVAVDNPASSARGILGGQNFLSDARNESFSRVAARVHARLFCRRTCGAGVGFGPRRRWNRARGAVRG
jgi:hypothetical protein